MKTVFVFFLVFSNQSFANYTLSQTPVGQSELEILEAAGSLGPSIDVAHFREIAKFVPKTLASMGYRKVGKIDLKNFLKHFDDVNIEIVNGLSVGKNGTCRATRDSAEWGHYANGKPFIRVNNLIWNFSTLDVQVTLGLHEELSAQGYGDEDYDCSILLYLLVKQFDLRRLHFTNSEFKLMSTSWAAKLCPLPGQPRLLAQNSYVIHENRNARCEDPMQMAGSGGVGGGGDERGLAWKISDIDKLFTSIHQTDSDGQNLPASLQALYDLLQTKYEVVRPQ